VTALGTARIHRAFSRSCAGVYRRAAERGNALHPAAVMSMAHLGPHIVISVFHTETSAAGSESYGAYWAEGRLTLAPQVSLALDCSHAPSHCASVGTVTPSAIVRPRPRRHAFHLHPASGFGNEPVPFSLLVPSLLPAGPHRDRRGRKRAVVIRSHRGAAGVRGARVVPPALALRLGRDRHPVGDDRVVGARRARAHRQRGGPEHRESGRATDRS